MNNRKRLLESVKDNSIILLFSGKAPYKSADETYPFTVNRNFHYMTGISRERFAIMLAKINGEPSETLFIERGDPVLARWLGERMKAEEAQEISGVESVDYIDSLESVFSNLLNRNRIERIYLDLERQEWNIPGSEAHGFALSVGERHPALKVKNIHNAIGDMRVTKSPEEIELLRKAIDVTDEAVKHLWRNAKPGMMEYELEAYFDFVLKSSGVKDFAFKTIMASGKNAAILHYSQNNSKTCENDLVLMDLGAQFDYYNADISRTFPISGKFTERQRKVYDVVLRAQKAVEETAKPGVPFKRLNEVAKEVLAEGCRELGLIKEDSELSNYYFHGVSHYIGLDTHDVGNRNLDLKPWMVMSNEPGLYIPEEGIGVRIEDDLLITENGCEVLSKAIIKDPDEIEEFLAAR